MYREVQVPRKAGRQERRRNPRLRLLHDLLGMCLASETVEELLHTIQNHYQSPSCIHQQQHKSQQYYNPNSPLPYNIAHPNYN